MTPWLGRAEAIHSPGSITLGLFRDIGWGDTSSTGDRCFGRQATRQGSGKIKGTRGDNVIVGSGQDDVILGKGGNDVICGGGGGDTIKGAVGLDRCDGQSGVNKLGQCEFKPGS
jgi:Ca2+-binding RTX toxin-like protein